MLSEIQREGRRHAPLYPDPELFPSGGDCLLALKAPQQAEPIPPLAVCDPVATRTYLRITFCSDRLQGAQTSSSVETVLNGPLGAASGRFRPRSSPVASILDLATNVILR